MDAAGPTLVLFQDLLDASLPTLREAPGRVLTAPLDIAAGAGAVLDALIGERELQKALFSADGYGEGEKAEDDVGLGAVGVEEGGRRATRDRIPTAASCAPRPCSAASRLGLKIAPGCLDAFLAADEPTDAGRGGGDEAARAATSRRRRRRRGDAPAQPRSDRARVRSDDPPGDPPGGLDDALEDALDQVGGALGADRRWRRIGGAGAAATRATTSRPARTSSTS